MAASINITPYSDALVLLGTAGIMVPLVRRFGLSPVLGYLGAGAALGPSGLGALVPQFPPLFWVTVTEAATVAHIADLGVVFLLFLIGIELSLERLKAMRRLIFGLGLLQIVTGSLAIGTIAALAGQKLPAAIVLGGCLALSSTAIVIEVLAANGRMATGAGRASFAVLLAQDLAVVPILLLVSVLASGGASGSIVGSVLVALAQAAIAVGLILVLGRLLLRPLFRLVANAQSAELFIAAALFVIVASGLVAAQAGLSMALGAFVAGLLLAETEYRKAIEATIEPFKGLLLGIFFFSVGMSIDLREVLREPLWLLAAVAGVVGLKVVLLLVLCHLMRLPRIASLETSLLLGPAGEFAFVGLGAAMAAGVVAPNVGRFTLTAAAVSMALIPVLGAAARRIAEHAEKLKPKPAELTAVPVATRGHAVVVGHGRVGRVVCALLGEHGRSFIAVDHDATTVANARRRGTELYYGDASVPEFLKACGIEEAQGVIITIHGRDRIDAVVNEVRKLRPDILIVSRARDEAHARHLYSLGVTDAVPETIEASLQLSEAALVGLGVPTGPVIASIHGKRDEFRAALQQAAGAAGRSAMHAIRPKTPPAT